MHRLLPLILASTLALAVGVPVRGQEPAQEPDPEPEEEIQPTPLQEPTSRPPWFGRVFIGANGLFQATSSSFRDTWREPVYQEEAAWNADYSVQEGPALDVNVGVRVWRSLIARVGFTRFTDSDGAAVSGSVPHPFFFDRDRSLSGESPSLEQEETAVHVGALWLAPLSRKLEVGIFGGPSFYQLKRDLVEEIRYSESYPYDEVTFEGTQVRSVEEDTIGFHVGADVSYYFTRSFGVGGIARYASARFDLASPASGDSLSIDAGGFQVGGGVRLRFGGPRPAPPPVPETPDAQAEPEEPQGVRLVSPNARARVSAPVFIAQDESREPLIVLEAGARLRVLEVSRDWLRVEFSDPRWGPRVGWIRRDAVDWD